MLSGNSNEFERNQVMLLTNELPANGTLSLSRGSTKFKMINGDTLPEKTIFRKHVLTSGRQRFISEFFSIFPLTSLCPFGIHHRIVGDSISKRTSINVYLSFDKFHHFGHISTTFFYLSPGFLPDSWRRRPKGQEIYIRSHHKLDP